MKSGKPVVLLDMDDVMAECCKKLCQEIFIRFGVKITKEDVLEFDIEKTVQKIDPRISTERILYPIHEPDFFYSLEVINGAREGVQSLVNEGIELVVVTKIPLFSDFGANPARDKTLWLERYFPYFSKTGNIIFTGRKDLIAGDILVDDAPHNLLNYPGKAIVFDAPWNREITHLPRALSWVELVPMILNIVRS